ncbi:hypothetical protein [Paenibacillus humicola]|uniref:hypothetical protein n=1 Tax=Paenibacillus humicola TaxID=3110540 RepID=UPI00237BB1C2|nr:hypothetical protein [Paenibacillus humicola]
MNNETALCFHFNDASAASVASGTLKELGFEAVVRHGHDLHIRMSGDDLTSALEIAQAHGGRLAVPSAEGELTGIAYGMDGIRIPAHVVNEDWIASEEGLEQDDPGLRNRDDDAAGEDDFFPDGGTYNYLSGDVHT